MDKQPKRVGEQEMLDNQQKMRELYDSSPYEEARTNGPQQGNPLIEHWITSATGANSMALFTKAHILVAGCGAGTEVKMLARYYPEAKIVGLDFSAVSVERAEMMAKREKLVNVTFAVADLTEKGWTEGTEPFDFILCHGVADYVSDVQSLMRNFTTVLSEKGVLYMTVNSSHHPAGRIRQAFSALGMPAGSYKDSKDQRALLGTVADIMGSKKGIPDLKTAQKEYLEIDIFPPICHHHSLDEWCEYSREAGLWFCGSMETMDVLPHLHDSQLPPFYGLGRVGLSQWLIHLRNNPAIQMLFSRQTPTEQRFDDLAELMKWRPLISPVVGVLPEMTGDPTEEMHITMRFEGMAAFRIYSTAFDLEVLRNCDGKKSIAEILAEIPSRGNMESFRACLYRAYHYGILADP